MDGLLTNVIAIAIARNDTIGGVFVLLTVGFAIAGLVLSRDGLKADQAATAVKDAAKNAQAAASTAQATVAAAQQEIAQTTGTQADAVAEHTSAVAQSTNAIQTQITAVNDALAALTGNQAPARVAWSFAALCLVVALVSFDLVSLVVSTDAKAGS